MYIIIISITCTYLLHVHVLNLLIVSNLVECLQQWVGARGNGLLQWPHQLQTMLEVYQQRDLVLCSFDRLVFRNLNQQGDVMVYIMETFQDWKKIERIH